jgi:predicted PhzF superfamily epimerase YddE/YHI9
VFSPDPAKGNPTLVVRLPAWPAVERLRAIAALGRGTETTFVVGEPSRITLRWFAEDREVPLCGHGALAASRLFGSWLPDGACAEVDNLRGRLWLARRGDAPFIVLRRTPLTAVDAGPLDIGVPVRHAFDAGRDFLLIVEDEAALVAYRPDPAVLGRLPKLGCILAAPASGATAAFRFFAPRAGIPEDRASGSVIPALVAYWGGHGTSEYRFRQRSPSGAVEIRASQWTEGVAIGGDVVTLGRGRLSPDLALDRF